MTAPTEPVAVSRGDNPLLGEVRLFLTALMFYTRIPCPAWVGYSDEQLNRSTRYFPAMGWVVGAIVGLCYGLARFILPVPVSVVLSLAAGAMATGAFHEDGFADVCDGFGGGADPRRTLDIMKDSRVGAFAVFGRVLLFGVKVTALADLGAVGVWPTVAAILFAHVVSRWCVVTVIWRDTYARDDLTSKVKPIGRSISGWGVVAASAWLVPFAGLAWWRPWWLLALPAAVLARLVLGGWFRRRLGGYTGDCLGCAQQVIEIVVLLTVLVCVRFAS
jgi:adenosylcobinamide-GDP ribazoletransferase